MNVATSGGACSAGTRGAFGPDRITKNGYDAADQLITVTEAYGTAVQSVEVTYAYSNNGKKRFVTDANGNKAELVYDGHDRQIQWKFPHPTSIGTVSSTDYEQYGYDAHDRRTSFRNRANETINYTYDVLARMASKDLPGAEQDVAYAYDLRGLQTAATFGVGGQGLTNAYDNAGRMISSTSTVGGVTRTLSHLYDANGNRIRVTHPDGLYVTYEYDALDRSTALREYGSTMLATIAYDVQGRRASLTRGNGTVLSYGYDGVDRLSALADNLGGTAHDQNLTFSYTPSSQIHQNTRSNDAVVYPELAEGPGRGMPTSTVPMR